MYLRSHGDIVHAIHDTLPELKDWVVDAVGQPVRRISRFMQLALIGAGRCARGVQLPKDTAVYLASSRGDLEITIDVMNHVFRDGQSPKPLSFVNTVSNSAAFYVAKCLGLESRSSFVCSRYFAFEDALQLALADFELGIVNSALIGSVDNAVLPLSAHRARLEIDADAAIAEGSHWMWLSREAPSDAQVRIVDVCSASDRNQLVAWIGSLSLDIRPTTLCAGQYLSPADFAAIQISTGIEATLDNTGARGFYASQSGSILAAFSRLEANERCLLHINGDTLGRFAAILIRKD